MQQKTIKRGNWFEIYDEPCFIVARQIRQDIWRKLQSIRRFLPVVEITHLGARLYIQAGGELTCPAPLERCGERIFDVLSNRDNQRRWAAFAAARQSKGYKQKALPSC